MAKKTEHAKAWTAIMAKYSKNIVPKALTPMQPYRRETPYVPSRIETGYACCAKPADKVYTGDAMIGIGTMHKSNAVPIFSTEEAKNISTMRRG